MHGRPTRNADFDDQEIFMEELQEILANAPAGFQARFARALAAMQQEKLVRRAEIYAAMRPPPGEQVNYEAILEALQRAVEDPSVSGGKRFTAALQLAKLRAERTGGNPTDPSEK